MLSNSDLLVGLLNAIGGLAYRITGERMILCLRDAEGNIYHIYPNDAHITWVKSPHEGAAEGPLADSLVFGEMQCSLHGPVYANPTSSTQHRVRSASEATLQSHKTVGIDRSC